MAITSRIRIKANTDGDLIFGQEFTEPPTTITRPVIIDRTLSPVAISIPVSGENYFIIVPPAGNTENILIGVNQGGPFFSLSPNKPSAIAFNAQTIWLASTGTVVIRQFSL